MPGKPHRYGAGDEREGGAGPGKNGGASAEAEAVRERLIDAFTRTAAERGYATTTVRDVAAAAGLSEGVFYDHFEGKAQCLSAAYDAFVDRLLAETKQTIGSEQDWSLQVKAAVPAVLGFVSETAARSRFFAVEALAAGPLMLDRHSAATNRIVPMLRHGREQFPAAADLPDMIEPVLIGGVACLVSSALLAEESAQLAEMEKELVEILLTPYTGRDEARRIAA
jgi:AcrR family transcriptional regulator